MYKNAVDVIDLVLEHPREVSLGPHVELPAVPVHAAYKYLNGALNLAYIAGYGETTLHPNFDLPRLLDDFGVDHDIQLATSPDFLVFRQLHDDDLVHFADLYGSQADAIGVVHGLHHIIDQLLQFGRDRLN